MTAKQNDPMHQDGKERRENKAMAEKKKAKASKHTGAPELFTDAAQKEENERTRRWAGFKDGRTRLTTTTTVWPRRRRQNKINTERPDSLDLASPRLSASVSGLQSSASPQPVPLPLLREDHRRSSVVALHVQGDPSREAQGCRQGADKVQTGCEADRWD